MADILENPVDLIDDTYEHPVDLIDDAYEQEIQVEQEPIEFVSYRSYNQLDDKPKINGVEIVGNKTSSDLGITAQINSAVNSEAQARQSADNGLQSQIDAKQDKLTEAQINAVNSGITAEKVTAYDGYAEQIAGKAEKGEVGQPGPAGPQGEQGEPGPQGPAATVEVGETTTLPAGSSASVTNSGTTSAAILNFAIPQGQKGDKGDKGDDGTGISIDGTVATYADLPTNLGTEDDGKGFYVEADGKLYIWNGTSFPADGNGMQIQGPQGPKGDKGDTGAQGLQGIQGLSATVRIGTTTTGEPGTQASVSNSGTESNAVLDFTIPRGDVGSQPELVQTIGTSTTKAMSQNATTEALNNISGTKQDKLTAGDNIKIENGVISSTDTTYTAGNGLNLNGTEFSADTTVLATKGNLEDYYTKPETDNLLAPKLETQMVAELPTRGEEGKLYLTPKAHTTQTATGNPITATVAEDAGQIESFQLDGDTFQQSYEGKNLININFTDSTEKGVTKTLNPDGSITLNGHTTGGHSFYIAPAVDFEIGQTYTIHIEVLSGSFVPYNSNKNWAVAFVYTKEDKSDLQINITNNGGTVSYTPTSSMVSQSVILWFGFNSNTTSEMAIFNNFTFRAQIEKGSTATSYEPYVGGTPSPNPDYPQPIQTVTGLQIITINGTDYPLDLGAIELCKLGDYQDYIYKDGDDWKLHKATNRAKLGDKDWNNYQNVVIYNANSSNDFGIVNLGNPTFALVSNMFTTSNNSSFTWRCFYNGGNDHINLYGDSAFNNMSGSDAKQWLSSKNAELLYAIATPIDTVITNQTLIAQLEAIRTASLENGANTITNAATGSNLAGDMELGYYSYNPRNRYDKWLWLEINNEYEQIGI